MNKCGPTMSRLTSGAVTRNSLVADDTHLVSVTWDEDIRIDAGQFFHVLPEKDPKTLLRRPFAVSGWGDGEIEILCRVVGPGTKRLSMTTPGERLSLLGPLGKGFDPDGLRSVLILAGGVGIAAFRLLSRAPILGMRLSLAYGVRTATEVVRDITEWVDDVVLISEDGSTDRRGTALDGAAELIEKHGGFDAGFACGPPAMIRALARHQIARAFPWQVSVEERMACGIGTCYVCAVPTKAGYRRACADGPVFRLDELAFEDDT